MTKNDDVAMLWYVAYGSNLSRDRFSCYLAGGRPEGGDRNYPGCRNPTEPVADAAILLPGRVYFAGRTRVWGGGMAVYDPHQPGQVAARAYLLAPDQFVDVLAQEMRQTPGTDLDLTLLDGAGRHSYGPGCYETLIRVGSRGGAPMVTFTRDRHDAPLTAPSEAYLRTMAAGIRETHGWTAARIGEYLAGLPGAAGAWTAAGVADLADGDPAGVAPAQTRSW